MDRAYRKPLLLTVFPFLLPGHLNRFQLLFVGVLRVVVEAFERHDPLVKIRKADRERIDIRMAVGKRDGNIFRAGPSEWSVHWISLTRLSFNAFSMAEF